MRFSLIGLSLLLISLQIYFDIQNLISDDSGALNKDYLVIKKEISDIDMIKGSSSSFNKKEILSKFKDLVNKHSEREDDYNPVHARSTSNPTGYFILDRIRFKVSSD